MNSFDLKELLRTHVGVVAFPYPSLTAKRFRDNKYDVIADDFDDFDSVNSTSVVADDFEGFEAVEYEEKKLSSLGDSGRKNSLGVPYFMSFEATYDDKIVHLPHEPLVSFSLRKNIVKTATVGGRKGTVKEFISADDYQIEIKGICVDFHNPEQYPADQVALIRDLCNYDDSVDVYNELFRFFKIYSIVIESVSFADMEGKSGMQYYEIKAVSDNDFLANLNDTELNKL